MLSNIILGVLILLELSLTVISLQKKSDFKREHSFVRIAIFILFLLLTISPIVDWSFRWYMLALYLGTQALLGIVLLLFKKQNTNVRSVKIIFRCLGQVFLILLVVLPALILPQYDDLKPTGDYTVGTRSFTITDESRDEPFTVEKDYRKLTIQFWYPTEQTGQIENIANGKFPLVIFSHGAFGYRMSNYSTYQELASNGYIVCSIDHTYQAFMTKQDDGKTIIGNMEFINNAMKAQNGDISAEETYELQKEWMKLRTQDMSFVINYIRNHSASSQVDPIYKSIDLENIGAFGHSLGGATAAQIGRDIKDVDAVIVVDGTMLGEIIGFENGKDVITDSPYPKPILNIYNEEHYNEALGLQNDYPNIAVYNNSLNAYQVVIKSAGHMNFTDLSIISPFLSKMLGSGDVDPRYCLEKTNEVILQFFDRYLKSNNIEIAKEKFL